ncbi:Ras- protein Rab-11A [Thoreauomyces humboldtii]|nr:Ras- protein Rab-11A [Thoreauomyces humboldtii]
MWAFTHKDAVSDTLIKIMVLGDSQTGKTSLANRILRKPYSSRYRPTVGIDFGTLSLKIASGRTIKAQIVDTSGLDSYRSITSSYWSLASGAVICYDITSRSSFARVKSWVRDFRAKTEGNENRRKAAGGGGQAPVPILLLGTKSDMTSDRQVPAPEAQAYALAQGFLFMETSAKDDVNVDLAFNVLLTDAYYATTTGQPTEWKPESRSSSLWETGKHALLHPLGMDGGGGRLPTTTATPLERPQAAARHKSFDERVFAMLGGWLGGSDDDKGSNAAAATMTSSTDEDAGNHNAPAAESDDHRHQHSEMDASEAMASRRGRIGDHGFELDAYDDVIEVQKREAQRKLLDHVKRKGRQTVTTMAAGGHGDEEGGPSPMHPGAQARLARSRTTVRRDG